MAVQSVTRVFRLLDLLADSPSPLTISELTGRAELPLPTVHRLLKSLVDDGYVRQDPSKRYGLGPRMIRLGDAASRNLGGWVKPFLGRLVQEFGETANMAILERVGVVYVEQVPSPQSVRMFTEVGRVVSMHSTGVGKALLSTLSDSQVRSALESAGMPRVTPTTITTIPAMLEELATIRDRGFAIDDGEHEVGVRCVAVPVPGLPMLAAVSVSGPSSRISPEDPARMAPAIQAVASELVEAFGWAN